MSRKKNISDKRSIKIVLKKKYLEAAGKCREVKKIYEERQKSFK